MPSVIPRKKTMLFSLRFSILLIFVTLFVVTTLTIIAIRSLTFNRELTDSALASMRYVSNDVLHRISGGIKPIEVQAEFSANLLENGVLQDNATQLIPYTYYLVETLPLVRDAYWANDNGNFIFARKEEDGSISTAIFDRQQATPLHTFIHRNALGVEIKRDISHELPYDPRTRPWYIAAQAAKTTTWTDVYLFYPNLFLGITVATPIYDSAHHLRGVLGFDISLNYLTQYITNQKVSLNGYSFIIDENENLIAYPNRPPFNTIPVKPNELINVHKIHLPLIDESIDLYKKTHQSEMIINYQNKIYFVMYQSVEDLAKHHWLVGVVTPKSDFTGVLQRMNLETLLISFIILVLGVLLVSNLITRTVKPIKLLTKEIGKIKRFDLTSQFNIHSRIKEIVVLQEAIHAMQTGLRQFQQYVPKQLVRQLIASGKDSEIGGMRKPLAILFSDIEHFTTIAEHIDANELLIQICEYFQSLSEIVTQESGTIDKYIGDSMMAFWGAPVMVENPCMHAVESALRCFEKNQILNELWSTQGKPRLETRFGIHYGEAVVGNIGSNERLSYTAIGDTINIASRLEKINKIYRTHIVVSETVYQIVKDHYLLRLIDYVAVEGRSEPIRLYELLGRKEARLPYDLTAYNKIFAQALALYHHHDYANALTQFNACLAIYPEDMVARLFIERCRNFTL